MKAITLTTILLLASSAVGATPGRSVVDRTERPVPVEAGTVSVLTGEGRNLAAREIAGPDTFVLYGGPAHPTEGKFQLDDGFNPDWGAGDGLPGGYGGGPGAWTPVDLTYDRAFWHRDTFNAANLNSNGEGNHAMWCGVAPGDPETEGWGSAQGYGNLWFEELIYESGPLADPSVGQDVQLDFYFNHDFTDVDWDFLHVDYDSAGTWTRVYSVSGYNREWGSEVFEAPGIRFSEVQESPIRYTGNDYGGNSGDRIRIRLLVTSDGAWSDEDGLGPTVAGAAQVDDITLTTSQGVFGEDFEGVGPYLFEPGVDPFAGDFADVYARMTDLDPCRENPTPVAAFVDQGQIVRNGPGVYGHISTGGATSPGIEYGFPGHPVVNYSGGLSFGATSVTNEIWSPEIQWDLPGPDDDAREIAGAELAFDVWVDLPLINGMFYLWHVRSADNWGRFGGWKDRNYVYYGGYTPDSTYRSGWSRHTEVVSDLLNPDRTEVQIALAVLDYASVFGFAGNAATPSPVFDNVTLKKYRLAGPTIATRIIDLAQDGFPVGGSIDASTQAARDALDIPFSMARDVNSGDFVNDPGDSVIVDVEAVIPGTEVSDIRMVWALKTNPVFEDAIRSAPQRSVDENVVAGAAGTVWTGEVVAQQSTTSAGAFVHDRFFVDLPDVDFMYPGDVLHYYIQATDDEGRVSTLPGDVMDFGVFDPGSRFDRSFRVRCLPTIVDASGSQPTLLVYNDYGREGAEAEWVSAMAHLGLVEGVDYDSYTVQGSSSEVSNGIGSAGAHGATATQLAGYEMLLHFAGDLQYVILSDGDAGWADKGDDIGTLRGWLDTPGTRNIAHFGDGIVTGNMEYPLLQQYVEEVMGVEYVGVDVGPSIGNQTAPLVVPNSGGTWSNALQTEFVAYGGCNELRRFDHIRPRPGAEAGHFFADPTGTPITDPGTGVASVVHPLPYGKAITFPFDPRSILGVSGRAPVGPPARALVLREVMEVFGAPLASPPPVAAPELRRAKLSVAPNPFNPSTTIGFSAAPGVRGSIRIFDLQGRMVRLLHSGEFSTTRFVWDGTDGSGATVASGIYIVRAEAEGVTRTAKVALVK